MVCIGLTVDSKPVWMYRFSWIHWILFSSGIHNSENSAYLFQLESTLRPHYWLSEVIQSFADPGSWNYYLSCLC